MKHTWQGIIKELKRKGKSQRAKASIWFFKTGKGQYGEGDIFFGVTVPEQRLLAKKYAKLPLKELRKLLSRKEHECRLTSLFILVLQYQKANKKGRERIAKFYLRNKKYVNNWDLVDSSASYILGDYLANRQRKILYQLAKSKNLWDRRIAIISTSAFIARNDFKDTLRISEILLHDSHDLIHKAVGWMLREVGKKAKSVEEKFLEKFVAVMPRTMLRYAIEKFPTLERRYYLNKK